MPDRTISILSILCGGLVAVYLVLVVITVSFAAYRTDLASAVRDTEDAIGSLEREYYAAIDRIGETDPGTLGLVKPHAVTYAKSAEAPALSLR